MMENYHINYRGGRRQSQIGIQAHSHKSDTIKSGRYRHILSHFINENDMGLNAFNVSFPGFWDDESTYNNTVNDTNLSALVSSIVVKILNIITSIGINISIHMDDFQVGKCNENSIF